MTREGACGTLGWGAWDGMVAAEVARGFSIHPALRTDAPQRTAMGGRALRLDESPFFGWLTMDLRSLSAIVCWSFSLALLARATRSRWRRRWRR